MTTPETTVAYARSQQKLNATTIVAMRAAWKLMTPDFDTSWTRVVSRLVRLLTAAQLNAAKAGAAYIPDVLDELGMPDDPAAAVNPVSLAGIASDGRPLDTLLYGAVTRAKQAMAGTADLDLLVRPKPATPTQALDSGRRWLEMATKTQISDAGRVAGQAAITARPDVAGYVRMLNPPACSRCVILAGRWYRWNQGFQRHPRCDCRHIPVAEADYQDLTVNPDRYFLSLSKEDQDKSFTNAGAQAIRDGADIAKVVNARRGMSTAARGTSGRKVLTPERLGGVDIFVTREATRGRGSRRSPRLMPESIYEHAKGRDDAIRLLKLYGYFT